jgi:serine/threonine-protein kinase
MTDRHSMIGRVIGGRFHVVRHIGSGGWGDVFLAEHVPLKRKVALKVLSSTATRDPRITNRFVAEARIASQLDHEHCVRVLDFGRDEDLLYLAMEHLDGESMQAVLAREGRFEPARAASVMAQVADALAAAHARSILHRDIKPGNIMLVVKEKDGERIKDWVKVCDFGLAKMLEPGAEPIVDAPLTIQGAVLGTPSYMSPEQARGEALDQRTDIFSWGVVFYRALSGQLPFGSEASTVGAVHPTSKPPHALSELVVGLDPQIERIVQWAMAPDREQRCASARELKQRLEPLCRSLPPEEGPTVTDGGDTIAAAPEGTRLVRPMPQDTLLASPKPRSEALGATGQGGGIVTVLLLVFVLLVAAGLWLMFALGD